jgi:hypothetical protein
MEKSWQHYWQQKKNKTIFILSLLALALVLFCFLHFLTYNENRAGYRFDDPILSQFSPIDVSGITFGITYLMGLLGIIIALKKPALFIQLVQAYTLITLFRMVSMYLLPLEAPADIIPLKDYFLQNTFYSGRDNLKDLFFSGHTATIFLFGIYFTDKKIKIIFFSAALLIGILVVLQHVHYSIDVVFAPVFAIAAARIQRKVGFC